VETADVWEEVNPNGRLVEMADVREGVNPNGRLVEAGDVWEELDGFSSTDEASVVKKVVIVGSAPELGSVEDITIEDEPPTLPSEESTVADSVPDDVANVTSADVELESTSGCFRGSLLTRGGK